jgi:hypothetical protein
MTNSIRSTLRLGPLSNKKSNDCKPTFLRPDHCNYNEIDPYAAQWLRNLIAAGHIAPGDVDERSIEDVRPD